MSHVTVPPCVDNEVVQEQNPNCETSTTEKVTTTSEGTVTTLPETSTSLVTTTSDPGTSTTIATTTVPTTIPPVNQLPHTGIATAPLLTVALVLISSGSLMVRTIRKRLTL